MAKFHDDYRLLFQLTNGDFQSTSDQTFTKLGGFTNYMVARVVGKRVSGGATVACTGGIYTGASKTGNQLVASTQSWLGMSGSGKIQDATLATIIATDFQTATPILSLTVGSTAAVTGDVYIFGMILD